MSTLFKKRPGSNEAVEGKKLYTQIETAQKESDIKWEVAVGGIREELLLLVIGISLAYRFYDQH